MLAAGVRMMLDDPGLLSPAVGLLLHFPALLPRFDVLAICGALVPRGQADLVSQLGHALGPAFQVISICQLQFCNKKLLPSL